MFEVRIMSKIIERQHLIFAKPFHGEHPDAVYRLLRECLRKDGFEGQSRSITRPFKKNHLPRDTVIVTDNLVRFVANSIADVAEILFLLVDRGCEIRVYQPTGDSCLVINHSWLEPLRVMGSDLKKASRSQNIKAGQFAAAFHRNMKIGRRPVLTLEIERAILEAYSENRSLRKTELALRSQGLNVSRSTVQRFLAACKERK
jgi:hypothetical protein